MSSSAERWVELPTVGCIERVEFFVLFEFGATSLVVVCTNQRRRRWWKNWIIELSGFAWHWNSLGHRTDVEMIFTERCSMIKSTSTLEESTDSSLFLHIAWCTSKECNKVPALMFQVVKSTKRSLECQRLTKVWLFRAPPKCQCVWRVEMLIRYQRKKNARHTEDVSEKHVNFLFLLETMT